MDVVRMIVRDEIGDVVVGVVVDGWSGLAIGDRLGGGTRNEVWAATLDGRRVVARRSTRSPESLEWELELLVELHAAGFRVPQPIPADTGARAVDGWSVFTWIDGREPSSAEDWMSVAHELRRLHRHCRGRAQRPGACSLPELPGRRRSLDADLDVLPPDALAPIVEAFRRSAEAHVSVIHGDPGPSNVRIDESGSVGLIDFDESRVDVADLDLANLGRSVLRGQRRFVAEAAADAWEAAAGWRIEREYAERRLESLRSRRVDGWGDPRVTDGVIELRLRDPSDVDTQLRGEDDDFLRWLSGSAPTRERVAEHIAMCRELSATGGLRLHWGIYSCASGGGPDGAEGPDPTSGLAGVVEVNLGDIDLELDEMNVAYGLFPWGRSRGWATRAVRLAVEHALSLGQGLRPVLKIDADNRRSRRVAERSGFVLSRGTIQRRDDVLLRYEYQPEG